MAAGLLRLHVHKYEWNWMMMIIIIIIDREKNYMGAICKAHGEDKEMHTKF
jgi:hypothetical protein